MQHVTVGLPGRQYAIIIGDGVLGRAAEHVAPLAPTRIVVVSDANVAPLYGSGLASAVAPLAPVSRVVLPAGEASKRWDQVQAVLDALADAGADRRSVLLALGGGVIGDIAGFAASIYMRGIRFVQVPTTLLAQVDSSVGGKTGINHARGKNLVGTFHQPSVVLADTATLRTLPPRELSAGLAEVLKHGLIADAAYFHATVAELPALRSGDAAALGRAIARSCEIKAGVVARDERESGERALLNFGHTFGHAIEALTGYGMWLHGEAVGCGMVLAADLSRRMGLISADQVDLIRGVVAAAGLPTRIDGLAVADAVQAMRGDKKAHAGEIRFVLLERIGHAVLRTAPDAALRATLVEGGYRA